jgi:hypothetical protein
MLVHRSKKALVEAKRVLEFNDTSGRVLSARPKSYRQFPAHFKTTS